MKRVLLSIFAAVMLPVSAHGTAIPYTPVRCTIVVPVRSACAYYAGDFYSSFVVSRYGGWSITVTGADGTTRFEYGAASPYSGTIPTLPGDLVSAKAFTACPFPVQPVSPCQSGTITMTEGVLLPSPPTL